MNKTCEFHLYFWRGLYLFLFVLFHQNTIVDIYFTNVEIFMWPYTECGFDLWAENVHTYWGTTQIRKILHRHGTKHWPFKNGSKQHKLIKKNHWFVTLQLLLIFSCAESTSLKPHIKISILLIYHIRWIHTTNTPPYGFYAYLFLFAFYYSRFLSHFVQLKMLLLNFKRNLTLSMNVPNQVNNFIAITQHTTYTTTAMHSHIIYLYFFLFVERKNCRHMCNV